ncbi:MAG: aminopeptidase N [Pseudomonadota bacterium]
MADLSVSPPQSATINRADYRPPDWLVDTVWLDFDLGVAATRVDAALSVRRNGTHDRALVLDEDGALPQGLAVDGNATDWTHDGHRIIIPVVTDSAIITFSTIIDPSANTQLMGLFASGGMLCTQCEAEGFRRIIPFIDRPDVMAVYTVRLAGDKALFPILLANGEKTAEGKLADGRHFAEWHDPWPKPSYLFAIVAGDLVVNQDSFTTASGKAVELAIWVRDGDLPRTGHAMQALKNSMAWDERFYGREYDLSVFNIVAVSDFNMGAMENKGLNIFNTRYILADADTASDIDFDGVEGVVAHEYFHNWSGNRVTCRDWFQLSLKEGFTVYRDQSFSADMGSAAVKRIEDVRMLRAAQFPEDNGPLAHAIRPDSYQEISNFYTSTIYNKGAEVIRMMATMVGAERFRAGTDLYFNRHDGEAATCEDFVMAMEDGAHIDLGQFRLWYAQAGTPHVSAEVEHDPATGMAILTLAQTLASTPGQPLKTAMPIPLRVAAHDPAGNSLGEEQLLTLNTERMSVPLGRFTSHPMLSFNRGFSAPIIADVVRAPGELAWLAAHDDDPFARYEALQALMLETLVARVAGQPRSTDDVVNAVGNMLGDWRADPAFVTEACTLPGESFIGDQMLIVDPDVIRRERRALQHAIGEQHADLWREIHAASLTDATDLSPTAKAMRKLRGLALMMLWAGGDSAASSRALAQFHRASGMTDRQSAMAVLAHSDAPERAIALAAFFARYRDNPLVLDKWFTTQAFSMRDDTPEAVARLAQHPDFTLTNPNRVRSLYGAFAGNQGSFHVVDGRGYNLLTDLIIALDPKNPQTAARMIPSLGRWKRFDEGRATKMRACLERILASPGLSRDTTEQASKSLAG